MGSKSRSASVEAILEATRRVIAERGPGKLTLSAIAERAGVSRPTLYRWFPNKKARLDTLTIFRRAGAPLARPGGGLTDERYFRRLREALPQESEVVVTQSAELPRLLADVEISGEPRA